MRLSALKKLVEQLSVGGEASADEAVEALHQVGTAGEPNYANGWQTRASSPAKFYKDRERVYLSGRVGNSTSAADDTPLFTLPVGYRPADLTWLHPAVRSSATSAILPLATLIIVAGGQVMMEGINSTEPEVLLDGLSFRVA